MFSERIRSDLGAVGSGETHQVVKEHLDAILRPTDFLGQLLGYSTLYLLKDLSNIILLWFGNTCVLFHVAPGIFFTVLPVKGCKFFKFLSVAIENSWQ